MMTVGGKVKRSRAEDVPAYKQSGWKLIPNRAFVNTCPKILSKMEPLPELQRADYKMYLKQNNIPFEF